MRIKRTLQVKVIQKEDSPAIAAEVTAQAIQEISTAMKKLRAGKLKDKAIALLIRGSVPQWISMGQIKIIMDALENLEKEYCK